MGEDLLNRIKALCNEYNTSIRQVEIALNFGSGSVTRWGKNMPSADKVAQVAQYFNTTTDYLLGREVFVEDSAPVEIQLALKQLNEGGMEILKGLAVSLMMQEKYRK